MTGPYSSAKTCNMVARLQDMLRCHLRYYRISTCEKWPKILGEKVSTPELKCRTRARNLNKIWISLAFQAFHLRRPPLPRIQHKHATVSPPSLTHTHISCFRPRKSRGSSAAAGRRTRYSSHACIGAVAHAMDDHYVDRGRRTYRCW